jgi:hypothetical protein
MWGSASPRRSGQRRTAGERGGSWGGGGGVRGYPDQILLADCGKVCGFGQHGSALFWEAGSGSALFWEVGSGSALFFGRLDSDPHYFGRLDPDPQLKSKFRREL